MIKKIIEKFYGKFCQCNDEITREEPMINKAWKKVKDAVLRIKDYIWTKF